VTDVGSWLVAEVVGVRVARPEGYDCIAVVIDAWWGRPVSASVPRLFLDHFWSTSRIAEDEQGLAGFLVAFVSASQPHLAYVHFVGSGPTTEGAGSLASSTRSSGTTRADWAVPSYVRSPPPPTLAQSASTRPSASR